MRSDQGIVCEMDDETIKVFSVHRQEIKYQANRFSHHRISIGERWRLYHGGPRADINPPGLKYEEYVRFSINPENVLMAESWATTPSKNDISEEMWEKYGGKIWAPFLGFLSDPEKLFAKRYEAGQKGSVIVQYAPTRDTVFKIVGVNNVVYPPLGPEVKWIAPWKTIEQPWEEMIDGYRRKAKFLKHAFVRSALCVARDQPNFLHASYRHGSTFYCDHMISANYGVTRCLDSLEKGQWYQHEFSGVYDPEACKKAYWATCATKVVPIPAPLPTTVVDGNVEVTTTFQFNHAALEEFWSSSEKPWEQRSKGIREDAHFVDKFLGKVEIYPNEAKQIIKLVESLHQDFFYSRKDDPITVTVEVRLLYDYFRNNNTYPKHGLFFVNTVVDVDFEEY